MTAQEVTLPWTQSPALVEFRALDAGGEAGPPSAPVRAERLPAGTTLRQVRRNDEWIGVDDFSTARALEALQARAESLEGLVRSQASLIADLQAVIDGKADATALNALTARVEETEAGVEASASDITIVRARVGDLAASQTDGTTALAAGVAAGVAAEQTLAAGVAAGVAAEQTLEARVTQVENVDGETMVAGLARWLVKTQVDDLVGGVGLYNDGEDVSFTVVADKFLVISPDGENLFPFHVINGIVYLDAVAIRDGTIQSVKAANAFLTDLTAVHGTLAHARIGQGNIFDLAVGGQIASDNFVSGSAGYRLTKTGVEFAAGVLGDLKSTNFTAGSSGVGWRLRPDGSGELDAAHIRGTLSADHIDSDVRNWTLLWNGLTNLSTGGNTLWLTSRVYEFDILMIFGSGGSVGNLNAAYPTAIPVRISEIPLENSSNQTWRTIGFHGGDFGGQHCHIYRSVSGWFVRIRENAGDEDAYVYAIWGVKNPSS